jgi:hypothetical protein
VLGGKVTQDNGGMPAESASIAEAGEPQHSDQAGGPQEEQAPPTPQELDERDEAFRRPRKPMGPVETINPETIPDEE